MDLRRYFHSNALDHTIRGIQSESKFITCVHNKITAHKNKRNSLATFLALLQFLRNNTYWFHKIDQGDWRGFTRALIDVIKQQISKSAYPALLKIIPIRFCKYCLLLTENHQQLCKRHRTTYLILLQRLPYELIEHLMQFRGTRVRKNEMK